MGHRPAFLDVADCPSLAIPPERARRSFSSGRSWAGLSDEIRILQANIESAETLSPCKSMDPARVLPKPTRDIPDMYGVRRSCQVIHNLRLPEVRPYHRSPAHSDERPVPAGA